MLPFVRDCRKWSWVQHRLLLFQGAEWVLSVSMSYALGQLGVHLCVSKQGSVSFVVTPSSRLLVWATSFQEGSQAGSCVLFGTELGTEAAKTPRQGQEAEGGRKELTSYSPTLGQPRKARQR